MSRRSIPALVIVIAGLIGLVVVGRDTPQRVTPFFASTGGTWMPAVGESGALTGTWICPGLPTDGTDGRGGSVVVSNSEPVGLEGRFMVLTDEGVAADEAFSVDQWEQVRLDIGTFTDAAFSSVVVEIDGGIGFVEQVVRHPLGDSVAACSTDTSPTWYLADGYTVEDSVETLILTNPFDEPVVADLRFSTESRQSEPDRFRGFTVLPRSVRTIPIAELGARDEPIISVSVEATAGRLVVGRSQEYRGGGRFGHDVSLAAPELRDQWWFADGERADGVQETFAIYNPTDEPAEVTVFFGGLPLADTAINEGDPIVVPPRRSLIFDPTAERQIGGENPGDAGDTVDGGDDSFVDLQQPTFALPEGRHATVVAAVGNPSLVVERIITRSTEGTIATSVSLGARPRPDGFVASTWHMGIGPDVATEDALVVYNIDQIEATIDISAIGPGGPSPVPALTGIELTSGGITTIDLTDPDVLGRELIVTSSSRVFIERLLPRGGELPGRSSSWLLPQSG